MSGGRVVYWPGKGEVRLSDRDHLATGGEGAVYAKGGFVYKLYLDPAKARAAGMAEKLELLAAIRHPYIIAPLSLLTDQAGELIGYVMPEASGIALTRTFANAWRDGSGFDDRAAAQLVEHMRETVLEAHRQHALMVDANELNWLADGVAPRAIDVDSWQIGRHRATAIMPSIRDPHASAFSADTDWYSWGVVSFQTLVGIHPYKGVHPDFKKGDLAARMTANASVFDPKVRLPAAARDLSVIPPVLRHWYERVFQAGERSAPPSIHAPAQGTVSPARRTARVVTGSSGTVRHDLVATLPGEILQITPSGYALHRLPGGVELAVHDLVAGEALAMMTTADVKAVLHGSAALVRTAGGALLLRILDGQRAITAQFLPTASTPRGNTVTITTLPLAAQRLVQFDQRVFALTRDADHGLIELLAERLGEQPVLAVKTAWPVLAQSTRFFRGCAIADALGQPYVVAPSTNALVIAAAEPLRGYRVLDAFARTAAQVLVLAVAKRSGEHRLLDLVLVDGAYRLRSERDTDATTINAAEGESGVRVTCVADGELVVAKATATHAREVRDAAFDDGMRLFALPSGVHYHAGDRVFRIAMS